MRTPALAVAVAIVTAACGPSSTAPPAAARCEIVVVAAPDGRSGTVGCASPSPAPSPTPSAAEENGKGKDVGNGKDNGHGKGHD